MRCKGIWDREADECGYIALGPIDGPGDPGWVAEREALRFTLRNPPTEVITGPPTYAEVVAERDAALAEVSRLRRQLALYEML